MTDLYPEQLCTKEITVKFERPGRWYVCVPVVVDRVERPKDTPPCVMPTDPGVRTFHTTVNTNGVITEYGGKVKDQLWKLALQVDREQARAEKQVFLDIVPAADGNGVQVVLRSLRKQKIKRKRLVVVRSGSGVA